MLYFGGVLGFVHAQIPIGLLKMLQYRRIVFQNRQRIGHLVIVVHQMFLT